MIFMLGSIQISAHTLEGGLGLCEVGGQVGCELTP